MNGWIDKYNMLCLNLDDTLDMVYICMFSIYREFLKPTITANCGRVIFSTKNYVK